VKGLSICELPTFGSDFFFFTGCATIDFGPVICISLRLEYGSTVPDVRNTQTNNNFELPSDGRIVGAGTVDT
jgi:hypothetical protein